MIGQDVENTVERRIFEIRHEFVAQADGDDILVVHGPTGTPQKAF